MFEADKWNADSLLCTNFFCFVDWVTIGFQGDSFPAQVPSGKAIFGLHNQSKVSYSGPALYIFVMA